MISRTISIITANWWFYLFFAAMLVIVAGIQDSGLIKSGSTNAVGPILWLLFARFVHRASLYGVKFSAINPDGTPDRAFGGFLARGIALLFLSLVLALPLIFYVYGSAAGTATPTLPNLLPFMFGFLVIYAVLLSLLGSWLPASVYQQNTSLGAAFGRGSRNFFRVFAWIAPTLLVAIVVEFAVMIGSAFNGIDIAIFRNGSFNPAGALVIFATTLIEACSVSLISVVLSHFYLVAEGIEEPALKS